MVLTRVPSLRKSDPRKICPGKTFSDYYPTEEMEILCFSNMRSEKYEHFTIWSVFVVKFELLKSVWS